MDMDALAQLIYKKEQQCMVVSSAISIIVYFIPLRKSNHVTFESLRYCNCCLTIIGTLEWSREPKNYFL